MALLVLAVLVAPPLFFIVRTSLFIPSESEALQVSLRHYAEILFSPGAPQLLLNSLTFAFGSSIIAIFLGTLLAWIVERTDTPFKALAYLSAFATFAIPGILKVIGWILLLGPEAGVINTWLKALLGLNQSPFNIFSMPGMIMIEAVIWTPVVFLFMAASFRSMDPALEESAAMAGAGAGKTLYHITLKLALPSILSVFLLSFLKSMEAFEIPALIGIPCGIRVLTSEIYLQMYAGLFPKYGLASAYAVMLIVFVGMGLFFYSRVMQRSRKYATISGKGFRPRLIRTGKWRWLCGAVVWLLPGLLVLPLIILCWASLLPYYAPPTLKALSHLTAANYLSIIENSTVLDSIKNSVLIGFLSTTATIMLTATIAWIIVRTAFKGKWLLDHLTSLALVFPGIVLGLALMMTYVNLPLPIYGTIWILVIGFMTQYIPYGIRFCYPGLIQINRELEESAQISGAPWGTVFRRIIIPLMMPSLIAGWIYIFLLSIRSLSLPVLLSGPGTAVVATMVFDLWESGRIPEIGAFGVVIALFLLLLVTVLHTLSGHFGIKREIYRGVTHK